MARAIPHDAQRSRGDFKRPPSPRDRAAVLCMLAAASAAAALASPSRAATGDRLIHEENFSTASGYDPSFWVAETGFFRNKEAQYYRPDNVSVKNGVLVLQGRRESALNGAYD